MHCLGCGNEFGLLMLGTMMLDQLSRHGHSSSEDEGWDGYFNIHWMNRLWELTYCPGTWMKGPIDRYGSPRGSTTSGVLRRHREERKMRIIRFGRRKLDRELGWVSWDDIFFLVLCFWSRAS